MNDPRYFIWSNEHGAWWRPAHRGYTQDIGEAGRYPCDEALRICERALAGWAGRGPMPEIPVPVSMMVPIVAALHRERGNG